MKKYYIEKKLQNIQFAIALASFVNFDESESKEKFFKKAFQLLTKRWQSLCQHLEKNSDLWFSVASSG